MSERENERLIATYWAHYRRFTSVDRAMRLSAESRVWAVDHVRDVINVGGPDAITLMKQLADSATTVEQLAYLGAGPLEDFVTDCEAAELLASAIRTFPRLHEAFQYTWLRSMPADAVEILEAYQT